MKYIIVIIIIIIIIFIHTSSTEIQVKDMAKVHKTQRNCNQDVHK